MSITSRINEMSSHIEQAYDELQGLGADLTNVNKNIENISMVLDDIYDSMPQVSGEGTSLTLDDTRVGKIKSTLKGNTSQSGTPTPTSPIPVNVVSGDNEINVVGKNLFELKPVQYSGHDAWQGYGVYGHYTEISDGYIIDAPYAAIGFQYNNLEVGANYTLSFDVTSDITTNTLYVGINAYTSTSRYKDYRSSTTKTRITYSFIATKTNRISWNSGTTNITELKITNIQLEKKSSASTYEPYQGNTYNIDLPEGMELCKIGNYQDYFYKDSDKWYLHKEIGKVVLNGSENISIYNQNARRTVFQADVLTGIENYLGNYDVPNLLSNMFNTVSQSATWTVGNISRRKEAQTTLYLTYEPDTTVEAFKTWLSTHNVVVYYVLATPVNTALEDM